MWYPTLRRAPHRPVSRAVKREKSSRSMTVSILRARAQKRNLSVSRASVTTELESIVNTLSGGTVLSKLRLARLLLKIKKKISAPRAWVARIAGSTIIALPISESSIKRTLRGIAGLPANKRTIQSISITTGVNRAQSGTPTRWSMVRMVSTLRLIGYAF